MANPRLSSRVPDLHASPIREILSLIDAPGMVSFAGGLPAAQTFLICQWRRCRAISCSTGPPKAMPR
jgi:DNA-binding transcriptional MocR family regulator